MPGTCGELVQGMVDGQHFLVSCPVNVYSKLVVEIYEPGCSLEAPADSPKALMALESAMRFFDLSCVGARVRIESDLPRGKGMASSTADIAGVIYATADALGRHIDAATVARLCLGIEPTDGSVFPGTALFDHLTGSLYEDLGPAPAMHIAVLDFGGEVDTVAYNAVDRTAVLRQGEEEARRALSLVRRGLETADTRLIGAGATISAMAHQRVLPKEELPAVIDLAQELGACGVNVAHSGTVIGVLFDEAGWRRLSSAGDLFFRALPGLEQAFLCQMVGGGLVGCTVPAVCRIVGRPVKAGWRFGV